MTMRTIIGFCSKCGYELFHHTGTSRLCLVGRAVPALVTVAEAVDCWREVRGATA